MGGGREVQRESQQPLCAGAQAIHWAADSGNAKIVKILLAAGAEIDSRDWVSKWTPLMKTGLEGVWGRGFRED